MAKGYNRAEVQELMDIRPIESEEEPQSPENIRFRKVTLNLYPDHQRVKVGINITNFITPPDIEIDVRDPSDNRVANASIIGASGPNLELTLHLRGDLKANEYRFHLSLGYQEDEKVDYKEVTLRMPEQDNTLKD